tara:strand:+ start:9124 stop:10065 length:942 start_codon:yes stop_codon:yes gene_type:complete
VDNKEKLLAIAEEIRNLITEKQKQLELSFVEDDHIYYMRDKNGKIRNNFPSVSTVIKQFYTDFPELDKSLEMCNNDIFAQDELLKEWRSTADYANNKGSRVHYLLETDLLKQYGSYKEVRKPHFECDEEQTSDGNAMIDAGHDFIRQMHRRGAILLDTEMVLGSSDLEYTGQPDKMWIMFDKEGNLGIIITDWKTNKPKNFKIQSYTEPMLPPFEDHMDTALSHYMIQLPLYVRLFVDMLKGTKYENIKVLGGIIVHLMSTGRFDEYRIPKTFMNRVLTMPPLPRIKGVMAKKENDKLREQNRLKNLKKQLND